MINLAKKLSLILMALLALPPLLFAQGERSIDMAETMRSEGKIYVVILVVAIVFSGLVIFAINSDRKISKLEKEIKSLKSDKDS
jgi:CcmD family protein